jgi:PKD repeat protein
MSEIAIAYRRANFTANVTEGFAPLTVQFTDTSLNDPTDWYWEFGDGATSAIQNPVYTYTLPGDYTVNLTVERAGKTRFQRTD